MMPVSGGVGKVGLDAEAANSSSLDQPCDRSDKDSRSWDVFVDVALVFGLAGWSISRMSS